METAQDYKDAFAASWQGNPYGVLSMATPRQIQCATLFEAQGYPAESAAAFVGDFSAESGVSLPTAFRTAGLDHGSEGLAQWRLDRLTRYEQYVKSLHPGLTTQELWPWYGRMDYQVAFTAIECRESYGALDAQLRAGGDIATLTAAICWQYERPAVATARLAFRVAQAKAVFAAMPKMNSSAPTTVLNMTAASQKNTQTGGLAVAGAGTIAAAATIGTHVSWHMPLWGWIVLGVLAAAVFVAIVGAVKAAASAVVTQQALVAATKPTPVIPPPIVTSSLVLSGLAGDAGAPVVSLTAPLTPSTLEPKPSTTAVPPIGSA
jgi:hypothetical protein